MKSIKIVSMLLIYSFAAYAVDDEQLYAVASYESTDKKFSCSYRPYIAFREADGISQWFGHTKSVELAKVDSYVNGVIHDHMYGAEVDLEKGYSLTIKLRDRLSLNAKDGLYDVEVFGRQSESKRIVLHASAILTKAPDSSFAHGSVFAKNPEYMNNYSVEDHYSGEFLEIKQDFPTEPILAGASVECSRILDK